jgi:Tfp pilus assembly protein PilV
MKTQLENSRPRRAFSLVEVVLALGVIAIVITTILGLLPVALRTGHSAQDETRGAEIAQTIFGSLVAQAPSQFNTGIQLPLPGNTTLSPAIDLTGSSSPTTPTLYAGNDGQLMQSQSADAAYAITIFTRNSPPGFDSGANQVTVRLAWPANAPTAANQTIRDFVRIISKY